MSRIRISLPTATTGQIAAQILVILRENGQGRPPGGYFPGCLESILQFEFAPVERGLDVRGGVLRQPGGGFGTYGGDRGSDPLRKRYFEAVNWLRQRGYIVRDHTQSSDQFTEVTRDGSAVGIDLQRMTFVIPRNWTHWRTEYEERVFLLSIRKEDDEFSGTAFQISPNLFATCEHNFEGGVSVYVGDLAVPVQEERRHQLADVAVFSLDSPTVPQPEGIPLHQDLPNPGEEVAILGYPSVPRRQPILNISVGAVESLPADYKGSSQFIQVTIPIAGGNSGGPLIDQCGRVLGVVSEKTFEMVRDSATPARPFSQVVPVRYLIELLGSAPDIEIGDDSEEAANMSRNIPDKEMKALIALSGGVCAFPGCGKRLVVPGNGNDAAAFLGEMAHIVADSRQGPRGDSPMSDEERDQHTNLFLLCGIHHKTIDSQPHTYSVSVLRAIKADHEGRIRQATRTGPPPIPLELSREDIHSSLLPLTHLPQAVFSAPCGFTTVRRTK